MQRINAERKSREDEGDWVRKTRPVVRMGPTAPLPHSRGEGLRAEYLSWHLSDLICCATTMFVSYVLIWSPLAWAAKPVATSTEPSALALIFDFGSDEGIVFEHRPAVHTSGV